MQDLFDQHSVRFGGSLLDIDLFTGEQLSQRANACFADPAHAFLISGILLGE